MPDQSSAATEHAILQEITAPLETLPEDPIAVVRADFPSALRGYDRLAVDAHVEKISQMVAELQATRSPEAAVRRALERVGEQITGILQRAHETAEQITAQSRREAEERLEAVRAEAAEILEAARQQVRDLDADTDRIWIERHRIVDDSREIARQLQAVADDAGQRFRESEAEPEPEPATAYDDEAEAEEDLTLPDAEHEDDTLVIGEDETSVYEPDVDATVRLEPLSEHREPEPARDEGPPPPVRGTRSAIPPASQAAKHPGENH